MFIRTVNSLINLEKLHSIKLKAEGDYCCRPCIALRYSIDEEKAHQIECEYSDLGIALQVFDELYEAIERNALAFDMRRWENGSDISP